MYLKIQQICIGSKLAGKNPYEYEIKGMRVRVNTLRFITHNSYSDPE